MLFEVQDAVEEVLATRTQLPLFLAWATTITRAQGMNLGMLALDFTNRWTLDGLVCSALSRATSFSTLRLRGLTRAHVRASLDGLRFHNTLGHSEQQVVPHE